MKSPTISVIVPVYNAGSTISSCIDSILNQSYTNFELLLINDGSLDSSAEICDRYQEQDSRVRVFHKANGGVSSARNRGLSESRGEYVVFCDSDDSIDKYCLEKLIEFKSFDIVLCGFKTLPKEIIREYPDQVFIEKTQIGKCITEHLYTGFSMPVSKLFRRDLILINGLYFNELISSGEDTLWVSQYLYYVKSIKLISYCGYYYNRREGSSSLSLRSIDENTMDRTIQMITSSYEELEKKFGINLKEWKLNVGMYFFHRYILHISESKYSTILSQLRINCEKSFLRPIFYDRKYVLKGIRLKVFNYLVRNRLYILLALNVKFQKRYL